MSCGVAPHRLGRNLGTRSRCSTNSSLGVPFVSLGEGIDTATPAGRLQLHILGADCGVERARIQERVRAGLARVRAQGHTLGRPMRVAPDRLKEAAGLSVRGSMWTCTGAVPVHCPAPNEGGAGVTRLAVYCGGGGGIGGVGVSWWSWRLRMILIEDLPR